MTSSVRIAAISLGATVCLLALKLALGILSGSGRAEEGEGQRCENQRVKLSWHARLHP